MGLSVQVSHIAIFTQHVDKKSHSNKNFDNEGHRRVFFLIEKIS